MYYIELIHTGLYGLKCFGDILKVDGQSCQCALLVLILQFVKVVHSGSGMLED